MTGVPNDPHEIVLFSVPGGVLLAHAVLGVPVIDSSFFVRLWVLTINFAEQKLVRLLNSSPPLPAFANTMLVHVSFFPCKDCASTMPLKGARLFTNTMLRATERFVCLSKEHLLMARCALKQACAALESMCPFGVCLNCCSRPVFSPKPRQRIKLNGVRVDTSSYEEWGHPPRPPTCEYNECNACNDGFG